MMHFYNLTLQEPQHIVNATSGNFTGRSSEGVDEIVVNLGTQISLYRQYSNEDQTESAINRIFTKPTFCHLFNVKTLSFPGSIHDYLAMTSDSGNITIADLKNDDITIVACFPFARTGMRRMEPGYYFNISPCGRAILTSALEKYKVAWPVNQSDDKSPQILPPIETTRSHSIVHCSVALDVGYESPLFAFIERIFKPDKSKKEPIFDPKKNQKNLVLYEVDPSIKSIVRRGEHPIPSTSTHLVAVPGPLYDCPGGVMVCSSGNVKYFPKTGEPSISSIPTRKGCDLSIIVSSATYSRDGTWLALLQNQFGDLLIATTDENEPNAISIKYYDTIPPSKNILILRQGVLVSFGENNEINYYFITSVDGDDVLEFEPNEVNSRLSQFFTHPTMDHLVKMSVVESSYGGYSGDIISLHGSGKFSSLKFTRRGIPIDSIYQQTLGGQTFSIKTVRENPTDTYDKYIFISGINSTRVLSVEASGKINETSESLFIYDSATLDVIQLETIHSYSTVQIHAKGLRVITKENTVKNWGRESSNYIVAAASNTRQIVIAYDDATIALFEGNENAIPIEVSSIRLDNIEGQIIALAIPQLPEGIKTAKWLAIATDQMMMFIISLGGHTEEDINQRWTISARQMVNDRISALAFLSVPGIGHVLHIGNEKGVLQRAILDDNEGRLDMPQMRFLGHSPISFSKISINGRHCLIANASSPFLIRGLQVDQFAAPSFSAITQIFASFCPDGGFVGVTENDLMIFEIKDLNSSMSTLTAPLPMTPRQIVNIQNTSSAFIACSDLIEGIWQTVFFIYDYHSHSLSDPIEYEPGYCVTSSAFIPSSGSVCLGLAGNLRFNPRSCTGGRLILVDPTGLVHHKTDIEDIPGAIGLFDDDILCGIGKNIRIYKIGMNVLLKRCESRTMPFFISFVTSIGSRVVVGDSAESYHFLKFDRQNSVMTPFCDDATPRFPLSSVLLDRATVASGDRFGNFAVLRIPPEISDEAEVDPSGVGMVWEHHDFSGTPNKFDTAASFHIGDPITSMQLAVSGHCIIYATVGGQIGAMIPLSSDADATIIKKLEIEMRKKKPTICGRVHELFRSYYAPLTNVTDGDLVKTFLDLSNNEQKEIAFNMRCTPFDISRQLISIESIV
ncbi:CPSF A subunit region family protein [Tritrichomonas foetus]|uniref:CPSF A subunit region family protein n=1 Tax=Tritrichomonas foetus TaxID=1144522 RepID=A0A1J4JUM0_9EUKA|nr:CPSF A subunit region family protein [Tritrichomonas foetus]|eukprot:OHT00949.1 CPSF A subunit region family protein [Tritrichomonas foetus]